MKRANLVQCRTRIADIASAGHELSDEGLRLVMGGMVKRTMIRTLAPAPHVDISLPPPSPPVDVLED